MKTSMLTKNEPDVILVGAGIMSATLAVFLKELDPLLKVEFMKCWAVRHWGAPMAEIMPEPARCTL
jgi:hypothetical protein